MNVPCAGHCLLHRRAIFAEGNSYPRHTRHGLFEARLVAVSGNNHHLELTVAFVELRVKALQVVLRPEKSQLVNQRANRSHVATAQVVPSATNTTCADLEGLAPGSPVCSVQHDDDLASRYIGQVDGRTVGLDERTAEVCGH